ncbi:P-loop containing nucleoside triphosphate hydrolase protein [Aspergillus cavernicola]|uniref:P-loop containing nucleoside triphosphate hydrolase protein n=1 Tax=Aspergillus cavernicola TaxID=176166 RepID=A0ABR4ID24_9EURO
MQASSGDPLDWTVDEVVSFLCHDDQTPWSQSASRLPRPDPVRFEASLRDNLITGEILLQDVDKPALRDDLGLRALGHRSSIMLAIRYLQQRSQKFQQALSLAPNLTSPSPMSTSLYRQESTPRPSPIQNANSFLSNGFGTMGHTTTPSTPLLNMPLSMNSISDTLNSGDGADFAGNRARSGPQAELHASAQDNFPENLEPGHTRPQEQTVIDNHGKKRRRLDLSSSIETRSNNLASATVNNKTQTEDWYMGPGALTPDQIFYSPDPDDNDQTFTLMPSKLPTAQRLFVNKCLGYFFKESPIKLKSDQGCSRWAVVPYKPSEVKSPSDKCFTLYTTKQGTVNVSKERIDDWPQLQHQREVNDKVQTSSESLNPSDPFAYLLEKYPVQEESGYCYPLYGGSGSEGGFDDETWGEIDDEHRESPAPQQTKLGPMEIESIIKECISEYESNWRVTRLPKEEYKAQKLWLAARRGHYANQEIKAIMKDVAILGTRLQKLHDEIRKNKYASQAELRTQCLCLEHTVFNIQKQRWRVSVLERDHCPPKAPVPPKPQTRRKPNNKDEESLDSDSDSVSNGSLDNFIIDDTETPEAIPSSFSSSDGDDDVISVSGARRRTRGLAPGVFASSSPSPPRPILEKPAIIDLTMESPEPDDLMIETPPLNPVEAATSKFPANTLPGISASVSPPPNLGTAEKNVHVKAETKTRRSSLPKIDDMHGIMMMEWELIEERQDRRRLLAKIIFCLSDEERQNLADKIPTYQFSRLKRLLQRALRCLNKRSKDVSGLEPLESSLIMRTASIYVSWVNCVRPAREGIPRKFVIEAREDLEDPEGQGLGKFYDELIKRLDFCRKWEQNTETVRSVDQEPNGAPHKKRKREVKESQAAKQNQASAQLRVAQQEKQRMKLEEKWESLGLSNDNPSQHAISFKDPVIYLDSHIAQRVKPHQLSGIRFMWRELIEDKKQQGCLLAHTMGLGKTMQVISLLTTISAAAASDDPRVREQVPEAFHRPRTLILCPSSLIENWYDEFLMWTPQTSRIGKVRRVSTTDNLTVRLGEVSGWHREGGVLLISYDIFRAWIINEKTPKRSRALPDTVHKKVRTWLLEGPSIIVADEAHKMKNPTSATAVAAMQFRSRSRIALTGSPLANNLGDYYTMVNWLAQDYLGSMVEFKAHFIEPISEGLYIDSTHHERRRSLMRLQVLKQILEPKINRADITVLEGSLPPKVEFVLTVPLTALQKTAYDSYAAFVLQGQVEEVRQAQLWSWLAILGLCCHHPVCFREKLLGRANDATKKMGDAEHAIPGDGPIAQAELPDLARLVAKQEHHFAQVPDMKAIELSARAEILNRIVAESIRAGDKVLVFSQSLPTLDYIEHVLKVSNWRYSRLDGQTPIATRQQATKQFNSDAETQVYLISTRAGGLGLNIPGANRVIIFDFSFSPMWEEQAVGRAYRLGQLKPVFVYRFIAGGTYEDIVYHKALFKSHLSVRVVDKKNPIRLAPKKPGEYLFPAKPVAQKDTSKYIGKDPLVLDKILLEDQTKEERLIRDIELTQTFEKEDNDKLTEEEKLSVQEELEDENLRRTDPEAYNKKLYARQMQQMQQQHSGLSTAPFPFLGTYGAQQPHSTHNVGPPALAPDMIMYQHVNSDAGNALVQRQVQAQFPHQTPSTERPRVSPNIPFDVISTQQQQQTALPRTHLKPVELRTPGVGTPQTGLLNTSHDTQIASENNQSEPSKPNSPIIDFPKQQTIEEHQPTLLRGQSVPVQLDPPVPDVCSQTWLETS